MGVCVDDAGIPGGRQCDSSFFGLAGRRLHDGLCSLCSRVLLESDYGLADWGGSGTRARICIGLYP